MHATKVKNKKLLWPDRVKHNIQYSTEIEDLINKLLNQNENERLGFNNDIQDVKGHDLFKGKEVLWNSIIQ